MKKLIALLLLLVVFLSMPFIIGCENKPTQPPPVDEVVLPAALTAAMNTGCATTKAYILVGTQWNMIKKFIPSALAGQVSPVLNTMQAVLALYNDAVITWADLKTEPLTFAALSAKIAQLKSDLDPLIAQIQAALKKKDNAEAKADLTTINEALSLLTAKGIFSCTIFDLKALNVQLKAIPAIE